MSLKQLIYKQSILTYYKFGDGKLPLICFAGYGQSGNEFSFTQNNFGDKYTIIAINWFGIDGSNWLEPTTFTTNNLSEKILLILNNENLGSENISFCSFSFGVVPLLALLNQKKLSLNKSIIMAAPGFAFFNLVNFANNTILGKFTFNLVIKHHFKIAKTVNSKLGSLVLGKSRVRLVNNFLHQKESLIVIKNTWQTIGKLLITKKQLHQIKVNNFFYITGSFDKITPDYLLKKHLGKIGSKHIVTKSGHKINTAGNIVALSQILLKD